MAGQRWYGKLRKARAWGTLAAVAGVGLAATVVPAGAASAATAGLPTQTVSFTTAGEHAFTVPSGITSLHVVAIGGRGGGDPWVSGGLGARVEADVAVSPGSTVYAEVGGNGTDGRSQFIYDPPAGGANGGGHGGEWMIYNPASGLQSTSGGGGGGASDLQTCPVSSCQPINTGSPALLLVAGGGGGGAGDQSQGGDGGTPTGGDAGPGHDSLTPLMVGTGATGTASGIDKWDRQARCVGIDGGYFGSGGGGGGFYCGGGGTGVNSAGGGGGGGSSYGPAGTTYSLATQDPSVTITYRTSFPAPFRLAPASRSSLNLDSSGVVFINQQVPSGSSSQLWQIVPQGSLYQIVNPGSGLCLATSGMGGDAVFEMGCAPLSLNLWQLQPNFGTSPTGSLIYNPAYNLFLDVSGGSIAPGAVIVASPYNGNASQYWLTFPG